MHAIFKAISISEEAIGPRKPRQVCWELEELEAAGLMECMILICLPTYPSTWVGRYLGTSTMYR